MTRSQSVILTAISGLIGTIALFLYFSAPFYWMPLPAPTATADQILGFGTKYHKEILIDTWLQQFGTILTVVFSLSLVHLSGNAQTLAGRLTLLASGIICSLSLAEGTFVLGSVQSGEHGHLQSAQTCFELTFVFIHIFLLAPSLFLMMGIALNGTSLLPKKFIVLAITLGILFQTLGIVALFDNRLLFLVFIVLMLQNLWTIAASIFLLFKRK